MNNKVVYFEVDGEVQAVLPSSVILTAVKVLKPLKGKREAIGAFQYSGICLKPEGMPIPLNRTRIRITDSVTLVQIVQMARTIDAKIREYIAAELKSQLEAETQSDAREEEILND